MLGGVRERAVAALAMLIAALTSSCASPSHIVYRTSLPGVTDVYPFNDNTHISDITTAKDGALWLADNANAAQVVYRASTSGLLAIVKLPPTGQLNGVAAGPDGSIWFTASIYGAETRGPGRLIRVFPDGAVRRYMITGPDADVQGIAVAANGDVWFAEGESGAVGCRQPNGKFTTFRLPDPKSYPTRVAIGNDGSMWFVEEMARRVGHLDSNHRLREFSLTRHAGLTDLAVDTSGNVWVVASRPDALVRIDKSGRIVEYASDASWSITRGRNGDIWFTLDHGIGRITSTGRIEKYESPVSVGLPITTDRSGNVWFIAEGMPSQTGFGPWEGIAKLAVR